MLRTQGYLRVKEAAELLGVSPNTVRAGALPARSRNTGTPRTPTGSINWPIWSGSTDRSRSPSLQPVPINRRGTRGDMGSLVGSNRSQR